MGLFGSAVAAAPAQESGNGLSGSEQARYLAGIQSLYLAKSERAALLEHCNQLLLRVEMEASRDIVQCHSLY
mgnify:CR=1 FL=1